MKKVNKMFNFVVMFMILGLMMINITTITNEINISYTGNEVLANARCGQTGSPCFKWSQCCNFNCDFVLGECSNSYSCAWWHDFSDSASYRYCNSCDYRWGEAIETSSCED